MTKADASISYLYVLTIKYDNNLKKPEVIDSDMASRYAGHFYLC